MGEGGRSWHGWWVGLMPRWLGGSVTGWWALWASASMVSEARRWHGAHPVRRVSGDRQACGGGSGWVMATIGIEHNGENRLDM